MVILSSNELKLATTITNIDCIYNQKPGKQEWEWERKYTVASNPLLSCIFIYANFIRVNLVLCMSKCFNSHRTISFSIGIRFFETTCRLTKNKFNSHRFVKQMCACVCMSQIDNFNPAILLHTHTISSIARTGRFVVVVVFLQYDEWKISEAKAICTGARIKGRKFSAPNDCEGR